MQRNQKRKPPAGGPGGLASASKPLPETHSIIEVDLPALSLAIGMVACRFGLPLPWAQIVAVAAGLGERMP